MSAEALQAEVDELRQELKDLSNAKDAYVADFREESLAKWAELDTLIAEAAAAGTVEEMSEADRQAILVELTKTGGG